MIQGFATKEATTAFSKRFSHFHTDFFTHTKHLCFSSLGIGTFKKEPYREENYLFNYNHSIQTAVKKGCNVIDTASNYRYGVSEQEIKEALEALFKEGYTREELILCSKGGFIPLCFPFPKDPYTWIEKNLISKGLCSKEEIVVDQHCLNPKFLEYSLERSLTNMGVACLDIYFLHNIEMQLGYVSKDVLFSRLKKAFAFLEEAVTQGKIKQYGLASWNAFLYEPEHIEYLNLQEVYNLAKEVGGDQHHFSYLQLPYNLAKTHAYAFSNQALEDKLFYTTLQAASKLGLEVITSASLLQMNLFKKPFNEKVSALLGYELESDVQRALQFARSAKGVCCALFSASTPSKVEHNLSLTTLAKPPLNYYEMLYKL